MADAAWAELEALAVHLEAGKPAVDEVELVLLVVEVLEPALCGGSTIALTPKAVTPRERRILRKTPVPKSSIEP